MRPAPLAAALLLPALLASPASAHTTVAAWDNDDLDPVGPYVIGDCFAYTTQESSASPMPSGAIHGQAAPPGTGSAAIATLQMVGYTTSYERDAGPMTPEGCAGPAHYTRMSTEGQATITLAAGLAPRLLTATVSFTSVFAVAAAAGDLVSGSCSAAGLSAPVNPADGTCTLTFWGSPGTGQVLLFQGEADPGAKGPAVSWPTVLETVVSVAEGGHSSLFDLVHEA